VVQTSKPRLVKNGPEFRVLSAEESIQPSVEVHVGFNQNLHLFMVAFYVTNAPGADNAISWFGVGKMAEPQGVRSPARWWGMYGDADSLLTWACIDTITPPPQNWTGGNLYPSPYMIDPGDTTHRFQLFTDKAPPVLHFYAQGFDTLSQDVSENPGLFENAWTGEVSLDSISRGDRGTGVGDKPLKTEFYTPRP